MVKQDTFITAKEFYPYMDGFRKEVNSKIDKYGQDFVDFEKGKLTALLETQKVHEGELKLLKQQLDSSAKIEGATYGPTKKVVDRMIDIVLTGVLAAVLGTVFIKSVEFIK